MDICDLSEIFREEKDSRQELMSDLVCTGRLLMCEHMSMLFIICLQTYTHQPKLLSELAGAELALQKNSMAFIEQNCNGKANAMVASEKTYADLVEPQVCQRMETM